MRSVSSLELNSDAETHGVCGCRIIHGPILHHIPYIYLHLVDLYGKLVGKYTIRGFCGYFMTSNGFHSSRFMITAPF